MKLVNSGRKNRAVQLSPTELVAVSLPSPTVHAPTPTPHRDRIQHPVGRSLTRLFNFLVVFLRVQYYCGSSFVCRKDHNVVVHF